MEVCYRVDGLSIDSMARRISSLCFGAGDKEGGICDVLRRRYEQMQRHWAADHNDESWNLDKDCRNVITGKPDARLSIPPRVIGAVSQDIHEMFRLANFGIDLPIWFRSKKGSHTRVMVIAQDPLRNHDAKGFVTASTPFGAHSSYWRNRSVVDFTSSIEELVACDGIDVYLTDYYKLFVLKRGYFKQNFRETAGNCERLIMDEIKLFNPSLILALGGESFYGLCPDERGNFREKATSSETPLPVGNFNGVPVLPLLHSSGANGNAWQRWRCNRTAEADCSKHAYYCTRIRQAIEQLA